MYTLLTPHIPRVPKINSWQHRINGELTPGKMVRVGIKELCVAVKVKCSAKIFATKPIDD